MATAKKKTAPEPITEKQMIGLMKLEQGAQTLRDFALTLGVSFSHISDIYHGRRSPGQKILNYFGMTKTRRVIIEYLPKN